MRTIAFVLSVFISAPAFAQSPEDMIARGHYARGATAYDEGHYDEALREFEAAHAAEPLPAFDYNVARCLDRLGRRAEALAAYERYILVAPKADNLAEVSERVALLTHELAEVQPRPALVFQLPSRPSPRRWIVPGALGGGALFFVAVGAGLLGSASASYHDLSSTCAPSCAPSLWSGLPAREHAGEALLGVAAVAAVVDVALIVRAARRK